MPAILTGFYFLLVAALLLGAAFIVFHLARYSLKRSNAIFGIALFLTVLVLLLGINILLFLSIPLDALGGSLLPVRGF